MSEVEKIVIETRIHLFSALAEAAETEHNLMCLYLYSMFGMKRSESEGVSTAELATIERWRKIVLGVCLEEMTHLSLVSNLFSALGGSPHFTRPNFPVSPGLYPAGMVMELAPFDLKTIEHFIFLERPESLEVQDADNFVPTQAYERVAPKGRLMPNSGDYQTVGHLYRSIRASLIHLSEKIGEKELFCGNIHRQITPIDSPLPGLIAIKDLASALQAIDTIITQGEGATSITDSHFERFSNIKTEYLEILKANPKFAPGRSIARNPVMRKPITSENRVWITHSVAARYMDLANAFYTFMLRVLVQVYDIEEREQSEKHELLEISFSMMHLMAVIGETLTLLPSTDEATNCFAGMSFAMVRTLNPLAKETELAVMGETLQVICTALKGLQSEIKEIEKENSRLNACVGRLDSSQSGVETIISRLKKLQQARGQAAGTTASEKPAHKEATASNAPESSSDVETAESSEIKIQFNAKKCIHTRHCVTELPQVFKANTPGEWLFPETSSAEYLASVIRECPSGALTYQSKGKLEDEKVPLVNTMRLFENGPYAFLSDLEIDGKKDGFRATLCRCGQSKRKPYCDHSHFDAGFSATGEPETSNDAALAARDGNLSVKRTANGPLQVKGNLEICAGTGRVVLRTSAVNLCRCGHSKSKPVCDGTHAVIGFKDAVL